MLLSGRAGLALKALLFCSRRQGPAPPFRVYQHRCAHGSPPFYADSVVPLHALLSCHTPGWLPPVLPVCRFCSLPCSHLPERPQASAPSCSGRLATAVPSPASPCPPLLELLASSRWSRGASRLWVPGLVNKRQTPDVATVGREPGTRRSCILANKEGRGPSGEPRE